MTTSSPSGSQNSATAANARAAPRKAFSGHGGRRRRRLGSGGGLVCTPDIEGAVTAAVEAIGTGSGGTDAA
jgi:hypothetical protein